MLLDPAAEYAAAIGSLWIPPVPVGWQRAQATHRVLVAVDGQPETADVRLVM